MGFSFFKKRELRESSTPPLSPRTASHLDSSTETPARPSSRTGPSSSYRSNLPNSIRDKESNEHSSGSRPRPSLSLLPISREQQYYAAQSQKLSSREGATRDLNPPSKSRFGSNNGSSVSLPLSPASPGALPSEKKSSRWKFGLGSRRRSISESVKTPVPRHQMTSSKSGFEVKSIRTVSRVQGDTVNRPYLASPTFFSSPPLPSIPISSPNSPRLSSSRIEAGSYRAPSPSSSMSVEQFRRDNVRSHSSTSMYAPGSPERTERPRFEPSRSSRSSVVSNSFALLPPRASFHEAQTTSRSRTSSANGSTGVLTPKPEMTTSDSQFSLSSFNTAPDGSASSHDHPSPRLRDRALSVVELDDELRLIALYGGGAEAKAAPTERVPQSAIKPAASASSQRGSVYAQAASVRGGSQSTPSLALQPATPVPMPRNPARLSMASNSKFPRAINWNDTSSDEEEDDTPLAALSDSRRASRSSLSLVLPSQRETSSGPNSPLGGKVDLMTDMLRRPSADQEVLLDGPAPSSPSYFVRNSQRNSSAPTGSLPEQSSMEVLRQVSRRSMSTFSIGSRVAPPPPAPSRTQSTPPTSFGTTPALPFSSTTKIIAPPLRDQRNSATSSSTTSDSATSSDPQPRTPKDGSPGGSILGPSSLGMKQFPAVASHLDEDRFSAVAGGWTNPRGDSLALPPPSPSTNTARMSFSGQSTLTAAPVQRLPQRASQQIGATQTRGVTYLPSPAPSPARSMVDLRSKSTLPPTKSPRGGVEVKKQSGDVYDRMKARHKAEQREAIAIGRDLNGNGLLHDEDDEDDEIPLANIPPRSGPGSIAGSAYGGQNFPQQQFPQSPSFYPQGGFDSFNQIPTTAPPGVDPYLYAALPPDQKLNLHLRSQQMLQIMAQASYQAKAESEIGGMNQNWETSSMLGTAQSSYGGGDARRASYGGGMSYPQQQQQRLPPFAPSLSASQSFYDQSPQFYSNPYFANSYSSPQFQYPPFLGGGGMSSSQSAIGVSTNRRSSALPGGGGNRKSGSTIGVGARF